MADTDKDRADELRDRLESEVGPRTKDGETQTQKAVRETTEQAQAQASAAMKRVRSFSDELTDCVQDSPLVSVFIGLGIGFVLGRVLR